MVNSRITRRRFIKQSGTAATGIALAGSLPVRSENMATDDVELSHIYVASNNGPAQNMESVIYTMGGIQAVIGVNDIVVIKTNAQQYNQGSANLAAIKSFIDMVLGIPQFEGEVIICDNNHRWPAETKGAWATDFEINSDVPGVSNLMDLIDLFQNAGHDNVTYYCWGDSYNAPSKRVYGPQDGDGYYYMTDVTYSNQASSASDYRETMMTYPVFTSSYSGVTIDLKNGAWKNGNFTGQPVTFIMFSGLCRHSNFAGVTSTLKNYFGVVDLSGGSNPATDGKIYQSYYNFHAFSYNKDDPGPVPGMLGGAVGTYLKYARPADLHITTAEWVGVGGRTEPSQAERAGYICASADPVALDYYCTKYILYPLAVQTENSWKEYMNPDDAGKPLRQYLDVCHNLGVGNLDEENIIVHSQTTPVNITLFAVSLKQSKPNLAWEIEPFEQFFGFEIQRKVSGAEFEKIAFIQAEKKDNHYEYWDTELEFSGLVEYRLKLLETSGEYLYSDKVSIHTSVANDLQLYGNYPNPFNSMTIIPFDLPKDGHVVIEIFNIKGEKVRKLHDKYVYTGYHTASWNGMDNFGSLVATGTYFVSITFNNVVKSLPLMFLK